MNKLSKVFFKQAEAGAVVLQPIVQEIDKTKKTLAELENKLRREGDRVREPLLDFLASTFSAEIRRDLQEALSEASPEDLGWTTFSTNNGRHFGRVWDSPDNKVVRKACREVLITEDQVFYATLDSLEKRGVFQSCDGSQAWPDEEMGGYSVYRFAKKNRSKE